MKAILFAALLMFAGPLAQAQPALDGLHKECKKTHKKKSKKRSEAICFCVTQNLSSRLSGEQLAKLHKMQSQLSERVTASKEDPWKAVLDIHFEVNRECAKNPHWKFLKDDIGVPDSL